DDHRRRTAGRGTAGDGGRADPAAPAVRPGAETPSPAPAAHLTTNGADRVSGPPRSVCRNWTQKSMSPPPGPAGAAGVFSGLSATTASVVRNSAAIDDAFCSAERVTLAGSMMPAASRSTYSPLAAL